MEHLLETRELIAAEAPERCQGCYIMELKAQHLAIAVLRNEMELETAKTDLREDIDGTCRRGLVRPASSGCFGGPVPQCSYYGFSVKNVAAADPIPQ